MQGSTTSALAALFMLLAACSSASPGSGDGRTLGSTGDADAGESRDAAGGDGAPVDTDTDAAGSDAGEGGQGAEAGGLADADADAGDGCAYSGAPGQCISVSACAALGDHTSFAGYCPGPASIECCIVTPSTADNPPIPAGYMLMAQSQVTAAMTTWAVEILDDPVTYPMFATAMKTFGTLMVLARVEWHPPDSNNNVVHRGVTLYEPV
jgi:hypothetical protein